MSPLHERHVHARQPKQAPMHRLLKEAASETWAMLALGCARPELVLDDDGAEKMSTQSSALVGDNLAGTNLGGINLAGTNLARTNLGGPNLGGTNLTDTNLAGTNLAGTNFGGNNLTGT